MTAGDPLATIMSPVHVKGRWGSSSVCAVYQDIDQQFLQVIKKHCAAEMRDQISLDTPLEATGIDSLGMSEVIFELEDVFNFSMPEPDGANGAEFSTLRQVRDAVVMALPAAGATTA